MDTVLALVHQHADYAPWIVFGLLMLAGLNIPVSEDAMILGSALLATERPDLLVELFFAVYAGAYLSDLVCYGLGRRFGPSLWRLPGFERVVHKKHIKTLSQFYARWGVWVLLVGRFIPFGVRNGLLLTAGLGRLHFGRLAAVDLIAATMSCGFYFWLYFSYGRAVVDAVARSQLALFGIVAVVVILLIVRSRLMKRLDKAD